MPRAPYVVTFYSFKGGVGRSMLLANVGAWLADNGCRVLLWDLDVEAPGLQHIPGLKPRATIHRGFLEWLAENTQGSELPDDEGISPLQELVLRTPVPGLDLLPAHGEDADFADKVQSVPWTRLFVDRPDEGIPFFQRVLKRIAEGHGSERRPYDLVLIDSRTGITDLGGLLGALLPHETIVVGSYGEQNYEGTRHIWRALQTAAAGKHHDRNLLHDDGSSRLERLLVMSPVPQDDQQALALRQQKWRKLFVDTPSQQTVREVPFAPHLLLEEELAVQTRPDSKLARAYAGVARTVLEHRETFLRGLEEAEEARERYPDAEDFERDSRGRRLGTKEQGDRFEDRVARLLRLLGYEVQGETLVDSNRIDLIATMQRALRPECYFVECKDHKSNVGKEKIQVFKTWLETPEARRRKALGMYVARGFSAAARAAADECGILALSYDELERRLFDFTPYLNQLVQRYERSDLARWYVQQDVYTEDHDRDVRVALLPRTVDWAQGKGSRLRLLLGDYGTGKSSFVQHLGYVLAKAALEDPEAPIPLAIDLRDTPNATRLDTLIGEHLRQRLPGWQGNPDILLHLLESGVVVLLLDSFDEMGAATIGRTVEEQFRELVRPSARPGRRRRGNRVLVTCRTHFFRDQQQVKDTAVGLGDDLVIRDSELGKVARSFDATIDELAMLSESQRREFVTRRLPPPKVPVALDFIEKTYDLPNLAPRPVLLEMILQSLPGLLESHDRTRPLTTTQLYCKYTHDWLHDRSGANLESGPDLRQQLLERLAHTMWRRPDHRLHHTELTRLLSDLDSATRGGVDHARLDLELRTAAFLTRTQEGNYGFSHKSFREYFLARHVARALRPERGTAPTARAADSPGDSTESEPEFHRFEEALAAPPFTPELLRFLAEWLLTNEENGDDQGLRRLQEGTRAVLAREGSLNARINAVLIGYHVSRFAIEFARGDGEEASATSIPEGDARRAMQPYVPTRAQLANSSFREAALPGIWLEGADLSGSDWTDADLSSASLTGACFDRALLRRTVLRDAELDASSWIEATVDQVDARGAQLREARFARAQVVASRFAGADLTGADFTGARVAVVRFADANLEGACWEEVADERSTSTLANSNTSPFHHLPEAHRKNLPISTCLGWNAAAWAPDGTRVLTAGDDGTARVWDASNGTELLRFEGHQGAVHSLAWDPDGTQVVTAGEDGTGRIWNAVSGIELFRLEGHCGAVRAAAWTPDGTKLLTGGDDRTARVWEPATGAIVLRLEGHQGSVLTAAWGRDSSLAITAGDDESARIWDAVAGDEVLRLTGYEGFIFAAAWAPDGTRVLTGDDRSASIWDARSGAMLLRLKGHQDWVVAVAWAPDGARVLTAGDDGTARVWDATTGTELLRNEEHGQWVSAAAWAPDGARVLTTDKNGMARIWSAASGTHLLRLEGHRRWVGAVAWAPDGTRILTAGIDGMARVWDAVSGAQLLSLGGHQQSVWAADWAPSSSQLLTAGDDGTARIWSAPTGTEVLRLEGHGRTITAAASSPDGARVMTAGRDGTARVWDGKTGAALLQLSGHRGPVHSAAWAPDGTQVLTGGRDGTARVWNAETGAMLTRLEVHSGSVLATAWASDGAHLLTTGHDGIAKVLDAASGAEILQLRGHKGSVMAAAWAPHGARVLTAGADGTARVWDAASGAELLRLEGHQGSVYSAAWAPDAARLLTGGIDGTARIWNAVTGEQEWTLLATDDGWIAFTPEGRYRGEGSALDLLRFADDREYGKCPLPTIWYAADLPELRLDAE